MTLRCINATVRRARTRDARTRAILYIAHTQGRAKLEREDTITISVS